MRRVLVTLVSVAVCTLAAACGDAPPAPLSPVGPSSRTVVPYTPGACDPDAIRALINSLYAKTPAQARIKVFNDGLAKYEQGKTAEGWGKFTGVMNGVLTDYAAGKLRDPAGAQTTAQAVVALIDALYTCANVAPPADLTGALTGDGGAALCLVSQPCTVVVASKKFFTTLPANFFTQPALVTVQRTAGPFPTSYTKYAPGYKVTVVPYDAQANFDRSLPNFGQGRAEPPGGRATVAVCPGDPHPSIATLAVLRIPDAFLEGAQATLLLPPFLAGAPLDCAAPAGQTARTASRGLFSRLGQYALSVLTPRPAYAWDGGVGGLTELLSTFVAADPNSQPAQTTTFNFDSYPGNPNTPIASGTDLQTAFANAGVTFARIGGTLCGPSVYANNHGPSSTTPYTFAFGTANNNVSVCGPNTASDFNQTEFGRAQATFATAASAVCIDAYATTADAGAVLEAFGPNGSLGVATSVGAWGTPLCVRASGITRVQFAGRGLVPNGLSRETAVFDNLVVTY